MLPNTQHFFVHCILLKRANYFLSYNFLSSLPLVIDEIADQFLVDRAKEKLNFELETKLFLGEVTCAITRAIAVVGGTFLMSSKASLGDNTGVETEQVTVGRKKLDRKWLNTQTPDKEMKISDEWTNSILLQDDISKNDV